MARRNLVIVRAGDTSLHPGWTRDVADRDWDLVVSYFGDDPACYRATDERRIDDKGLKFGGLHALLQRETFWLDYDYILLPDDDLSWDQDAISLLFAEMRAAGFLLAQPALAWGSYFSLPITLHHPSFRVRVTDFVEIMVPCFRRDFLVQCLPTFTANLSGWGLSSLWPSMLPPGKPLCGIVDSVQVTHTRAVGGPSYGPLRAAGVSAKTERRALLAIHDLPADQPPRVLAAIERSGARLNGGDPADARRLSELVEEDEAGYRASGWCNEGGHVRKSGSRD